MPVRLQMGNSSLPAEAWTPWGGQRLFARTNPTAQPNDLGGSIGSAFVIPFLPFSIVPFRPVLAGEPGLVVLGDGHTVGRKETACPNQGGTHPYRSRVTT